jgi:diadenosine tetraphosphate (Ap4A) HIT family hydrolase
MKVPVWAHELAADFWTRVGKQVAFPRTLEAAMEAAYPITVKRLAELRLRVIAGWLSQLGIAIDVGADRALCGCLVAVKEHAFVFVDADDDADEQRFTLAHELAHFLRDVWRPRQRAVRLLGEGAAAAFDRDRPPSLDERFVGALEGIVFGVELHLLPRAADGEPAHSSAWCAEDSADVLAFELLAPAAHLFQAGADTWSDDQLLDRLQHDYGLPRRAAEEYLERLRPAAPAPARWLQELRSAR